MVPPHPLRSESEPSKPAGRPLPSRLSPARSVLPTHGNDRRSQGQEPHLLLKLAVGVEDGGDIGGGDTDCISERYDG